MTAEDAEIARNVRRELSKRPINSSMVDVQVKAGKITLTGRLTHLRDDKGANLKTEMDFVMKSVTRDRLVKGFFDQLQYTVDHSEEDEKDRNTRGRMRT
jgi:hypothetical protein